MFEGIKEIVLKFKRNDTFEGQDLFFSSSDFIKGVQKTHIISVTNQKGGCAKTTTAINLSSYLAKMGFRVLLVDLDSQSHACLGLGLKPYNLTRSIYDVFLKRMEIDAIIQNTLVANLDIAPSNALLSGLTLELANFLSREYILRFSLKRLLLKKIYDYIILDCSPSLNLVTLNALSACDFVLIPVQAHYFSLEGMKELFSTIQIVKDSFNPDIKALGILVTLFNARLKVSHNILSQMQEFFAHLLFDTSIHLDVKLIEATIHKLPIHLYSPNSRGAKEYRELSLEVVNLTQPDFLKREEPETQSVYA